MNAAGTRIQASYVTGRRVTFFGLLFLISQATIAFLLHRGGAAHTLIELQLTFDAGRFAELLAALEPRQQTALMQHFYLDFLHPVWYSAFAFLLTLWLFRRHGFASNWQWIAWLAPLMGALDLVENGLHLPLIAGSAAPTQLAVASAATCASLKWLLAGFFTVMNLALLLRPAPKADAT